MPDASLTIRSLTLPEVGTLVGWAAGEGWNPGLHDAAAFHAADPDGFLGGFVEGEMVSGISAVAYGADFGFIGLYICRPDMRGRGYGKAVWDAGMARLASRTVGLDGVPQQQANYRSMGFVPAYRTFRFSGRFTVARARASVVRPLTPELFAAVAAFDRGFFPAPREAFLRRWLAPPHLALACADGDAIQGYGVARACRDGFKIGPLLARDREMAEDLLSALDQACGSGIHIDVPETSGGFAGRLAGAGLTQGFETARMYRGPAPAIAFSGVFGVTTLELG
jgi:GNAT acetyltransferase-like protein/acetyltransferase (GNAT) family protein